MFEGLWVLLRHFFLTLLCLSSLTAAAQPLGRVIVKFRPDSVVVKQSPLPEASGSHWAETRGRLAKRLEAVAARSGKKLSHVRALGARTSVAESKGVSSKQLAALLAQQPDVEYAVADQLRFPRAIPNDTLYSARGDHPIAAAGQWYFRAPSSDTPAAINAEAAWDRVYSRQVSVAVLDSGIRPDHEDLADNLLAGYNMISDPIRAGLTIGMGRTADASDKGDWLTQNEINANPASYPEGFCRASDLSSWHGTAVSSVIAAIANNGLGLTGLGRNTKILPLRVLGKCGGYDSDIIDGMRWAAGLAVDGVAVEIPQPRARVLNMSLGVEGECSAAYIDAMADMDRRGVVVVAAAGNNVGGAVESPANCPGVIAVGALRHLGTKAGYSAVGRGIALSAPGGNCVNTDGGPCLYPILTASNVGMTTPISHFDGGSIYNGEGVGTSFAVPLVAGTAAMMLSTRPSLTPQNVRQILINSARPFPPASNDPSVPVCQEFMSGMQDECHCTTRTCGAGMLDVAAAISAAEGDPLVRITASSTQIKVGQTLTLDASASVPSERGSSVVSFNWELIDGGGALNRLTGDVSQSVLKITPTNAGELQIKLTIVDNVGKRAYETRSVVVLPAPKSESGKGGGGGGSVDIWSIAGLLAVLALIGMFRDKRRLDPALR